MLPCLACPCSLTPFAGSSQCSWSRRTTECHGASLITAALWALLPYNNNIKGLDPLPSEVSGHSVKGLSLFQVSKILFSGALSTCATRRGSGQLVSSHQQRWMLTVEKAERQPVRWKWFPIILQRAFSGSMQSFTRWYSHFSPDLEQYITLPNLATGSSAPRGISSLALTKE